MIPEKYYDQVIKQLTDEGYSNLDDSNRSLVLESVFCSFARNCLGMSYADYCRLEIIRVFPYKTTQRQHSHPSILGVEFASHGVAFTIRNWINWKTVNDNKASIKISVPLISKPRFIVAQKVSNQVRSSSNIRMGQGTNSIVGYYRKNPSSSFEIKVFVQK